MPLRFSVKRISKTKEKSFMIYANFHLRVSLCVLDVKVEVRAQVHFYLLRCDTETMPQLRGHGAKMQLCKEVFWN